MNKKLHDICSVAKFALLFAVTAWLSGMASESKQYESNPRGNRHPSKDGENEWASDNPPVECPYPTEGQHRAAEQAYWEKQTRLSRWTLLASAIAAGAAVGGYFIIKDTLVATQEAAKAAFMQATANRAYLFISYPPENSPTYHSPFLHLPSKDAPPDAPKAFTLQFAIANYGDSPAVITKIDTQVFAAVPDHPTEPDPINPGRGVIREAHKSPLAFLDKGDWAGGKDEAALSRPVIIPGKGSSGAIQEDFSFIRNQIPDEWVGPLYLFVRATYLDIYRTERCTEMYIWISGNVYGQAHTHNDWDCESRQDGAQGAHGS